MELPYNNNIPSNTNLNLKDNVPRISSNRSVNINP